MKSNLALLGILALALGACDKKEEVSQTATPPKKKALSSEQRPSSFKPVAPKPKPAVQPEIALTPADAPDAISPPAPPHPVAPAQQTPSASEQATEQLRQERLARMAKVREERITQATVQLTTRFKEQDTNADGFLAKDELNGRMQRRFAEADKNSDGFLDATEQQAMIQASAQRMGDGGGQRRGNRNP